MSEHRISSAAFIGSGVLLVACADIWISKGNRIAGVITACPVATAWCERSGIPHTRPESDQLSWLCERPFDYLFSVVNHAVTPEAVLRLAARRAINYHDAPLPKYAGFNATSWAILNGESTHAVTWHAMTADVDGGDILLQRAIDIHEDDTAFSLGAKCVEAGRESFEQLVDMLAMEVAGSDLAVCRQGPREQFHLRSDRPGLGVIDFTQTIQQVRNQVRALNLGTDDNWMCRPKLALPAGLVVVEHADCAGKAVAAPGTVLVVDRSGIVVAVADGAVRFQTLSTLEGVAVDPARTGVTVGERLAAFVDRGAELDAVLTKHERFWVNRLASARSPAIQGLKAQAGEIDPALEIRKLPAAISGGTTERRTALVAALIAYIARTYEDEGFDLGLAKTLPDGLREAYAAVTPFRVGLNRTLGFGQLKQLVGDELGVQEKRGSHARDAVMRYEALRARGDQTRLAVGIQFADLDKESSLTGDIRLALVIPDTGDSFGWAFDRRSIDDASLRTIADRIDALLVNGLLDATAPIATLDILPRSERTLLLETWQGEKCDVGENCVHQLFEAQVAKTPDAVALRFRGASLTYRQLDERANSVAEALQVAGVAPNELVAICMERSLDLVVAMMGVLKAGGAYVPLDPAYPRERLAMMLEDSRAKVVFTQRELASELPIGGAVSVCIEDIPARSALAPRSGVTKDDLAYVIFTSGSTGRPKGVMIRHRNVANFFVGMDARIGASRGVWLAVTSVSFDISVLEIFWTLTRGFEVIIQPGSDRISAARAPITSKLKQPMDFSLFYFAAGQGDSAPGSAYRLLLEGAKFADTHDFSAVWTPERHFHEFGGPYPNPAVTTAALATMTNRVSLRAGSVVLPLHNPLRVAEDWSVIDQLSGGRIGLSFASGWHADDFAFMPQNYERRREVMLESIDTVLKLWRGEKVETVNGQGKTISVSVLPRPVQTNPPMWIASAGSVDTFKVAGRIGANVLTNMLGQDIDDLRQKFAAYREARREAGHEGEGSVTVMLHTFVCEDTNRARELAREPFCNYLKSSFDLIKVAPSMFPAFRQPSLGAGEGKAFDATSFTPEDMAALMEHAFDRYFETAGLFGAPSKALAMIDRLKSIGANEVACLIDFGIDVDVVLESLSYLDQLRKMSNATSDRAEADDFSIPAQIRKHGVTHLQCTPSLARMILSEPEGLASLAELQYLLVGGEALPKDLADQLSPIVKGEIHNMYGPTETTIWSTTSRVRAGEAITIGRPIRNTTIRILDVSGQLAPVGVAGELCIGGEGVAAGYLGRPDLTAERFVADAFSLGGLLYRTGDLARYTTTGDIEFLGRLDHQVKIDGYRIELGEIETVLGQHEHVDQAVVVARSDEGTTRLVAYVVGPQAASNEAAVHVDRWRKLWDGAYREAANVQDPRFNISGWNDSVTGAQIPSSHMREWLDGVERRVLALSPKRVLEVGCGTGLVLYRVLPHVEHYTGIDLSEHALAAIQAELSESERAKVTLLQRSADALDGIADRSCDLVIINSVAQYFPDAAYFERVLRSASRIVQDGGAIFVGDVRNLAHMEAFHTQVALQQAPASASGEEIRKHVDRRISQEGELLVNPEFFHAVVRNIPRFAGVEIQLKPGRSRNEMNAFRYDVVIRVDEKSAVQTVTPARATHAGLPAMLDRGVAAILVQDIPNARVAGIYAACAELAESTGSDVARARNHGLSVPADAVDPADMEDIDQRYDVITLPALSGNPQKFDAILRNRSLNPSLIVECGRPEHGSEAASYARAPRRDTPVGSVSADDLRVHLRNYLPDYMIPSAFVTLDALPLTPNGKVDRKALPRPSYAGPAMRDETYIAPSSGIEETIAGVWKTLLGVDRVGLRDNIFDLGANSLLTVQANQRLSMLLERRIALVSMFRYPTVETLAAHLSQGQAQPNSARVQDREVRKKDAAARRRELRSANQG